MYIISMDFFSLTSNKVQLCVFVLFFYAFTEVTKALQSFFINSYIMLAP